MNELLIPVGIGVAVAITVFIYAIRTTPEVKEEAPKEVHQVRKVTFVVSEADKPKKKKKKYYNNKKKKPTVAESATPVAKRPVGRPRKTTE
jgi:predicted small secreted protein